MNSELKQLYSEQEILQIYQTFLKQKLFAVDKPLFWTSQDVVSFLKSFLQVKKIGHAGTLDPLASGLLIVAIDDATKQLTTLLNEDKTYQAVIKLHQHSETGDQEGPIVVHEKVAVTTKQIENAISYFNGLEYYQPPHKYSAVKVGGKKLYEYSRKGQSIQIQAKKVQIKSLELISFVDDLITINLTVTKGFYVRTFAEELASKVNTVGYLQKLVRTSCLGFELTEETVKIQKLKKSLKKIHKY